MSGIRCGQPSNSGEHDARRIKPDADGKPNLSGIFVPHFFMKNQNKEVLSLSEHAHIFQNPAEFQDLFRQIRLVAQFFRNQADAAVNHLTCSEPSHAVGFNEVSDVKQDKSFRFDDLIRFISRSRDLRTLNVFVENDEQIKQLVKALNKKDVKHDFSLNLRLPKQNSSVTVQGLATLGDLKNASKLSIENFQLEFGQNQSGDQVHIVNCWKKIPNLKSLDLNCNSAFTSNHNEHNITIYKPYTVFLTSLNKLDGLHTLRLRNFLRYSFHDDFGVDVFQEWASLKNLEELTLDFNQDEDCDEHDASLVYNQSVAAFIESNPKLKILKFELPYYWNDFQDRADFDHYSEIGKSIANARFLECLCINIPFWARECSAIPTVLIQESNKHLIQEITLRSPNRVPGIFIDHLNEIVSDSTLETIRKLGGLRRFTVLGCCFTSGGILDLLHLWPDKLQEFKIEKDSLQLDQPLGDQNVDYPDFNEDFLIKKTENGFIFKYSQTDDCVNVLIDLLRQNGWEFNSVDNQNADAQNTTSIFVHLPLI